MWGEIDGRSRRNGGNDGRGDRRGDRRGDGCGDRRGDGRSGDGCGGMSKLCIVALDDLLDGGAQKDVLPVVVQLDYAREQLRTHTTEHFIYTEHHSPLHVMCTLNTGRPVFSVQCSVFSVD